ncbi:MAG TPA: tetratricopeptide repeat protein [Verrucomicrobiae bacterium]|jgi:Tfp pilus assembly protein PilF|nr:tetratricopeptide repeat protein [Verrucomicrobiae bacterium]
MTKKDQWRVLTVCLVLGLGTIALYAPAFNFTFVNYDDAFYVVNNPHVNKGLAGAFGWAFQVGQGVMWQPLTWLSHALDCQIYGLKPGGHHATSLILHALNSMLVFLVLRQLTGAFWRSAAVAAFFAWHPLHVEVAAWIAERKDVLCAFFWLLALWAYTCYVQNSKAPRSTSKFYYVCAIVLFALALMSNPVAVTLPLILFFLDWWPLGRLATTPERPAAKQFVALVIEKIPFFVLSVASSVMTFIAVEGNHFLNPMAQLDFRVRFIHAGMSYFRYLAKSFWPSDLGAAYPLVLRQPILPVIGVALVLVAITVVAIQARKTRPYWLVGWLWFLAALFPLLNVVQIGTQPMADHYMYLPSVGLWMLVCWEAYDLTAPLRNGRVVLGGLCAVLLGACCVTSWIQLGYWKNEETLLSRIPDSKSNPKGHADYIAFLLLQRQIPQAQAECQKAIALFPDSAAFQALFGDVLSAQGKSNEAIEKYKLALQLDPNSIVARVALGHALLAKKRAADAEAEFKTVIHDQPKNFEAHALLAKALLLQGQATAATAEFRASLSLEANQPETLNEFAWLLATDPHAEIRHGADAVQMARRACELARGQEPSFLGTLAAAYAETGDFDKAVAAGQAAHDLALAQGRKPLAETNEQLLVVYRAHKPFREKQ